MFFVAAYDLNDGTADALAENRPAHLTHAASGLVRIVMAGPTRGDGGVNGGLFVFEAPDMQVAERFCQEDPYTRSGVWRLLALREFDKRVG